MSNARESLKGKWGLAIGTLIVFMLVVVGIQIVPVAGAIAGIIISGPMTVGAVRFFMSISRKEEAQLNQIFSGFDRFGPHLVAYLLQMLYILLWALLLIIPGIIAAISYSMTYFILAEDSTITASDALAKSKEMMQGNKWKLVCLGCRFILWYLACILTLGIGFLWLAPYSYVSVVQFYDDLKETDIDAQSIA